MKKIIINSIPAIALAWLSVMGATAQEAEKAPLSVAVGYHLINNQVPFVVATLKTKVEKKFTPVEGMEVQFYLDKDAAGGGQLLGKAKTNAKGRVSMPVNVAAQNNWKSAEEHKIIAVTAKSKQFDETSTDAAVVKSRITLDTADDKGVKMTFEEWKSGAWAPVKGVEFKLGVKRLLSDLDISETETYTTDSLGKIQGEFKRTNLPGDEHGNLVLVAKCDDNETYGSLRFEKTVPWGGKAKLEGGAIGRALWGARFHSPWWLMAIAYSIVVGVWGTLMYLVYVIYRIKAIGREHQRTHK
jgi:hypothetical protein